jgi:hypothetical protein
MPVEQDITDNVLLLAMRSLPFIYMWPSTYRYRSIRAGTPSRASAVGSIEASEASVGLRSFTIYLKMPRWGTVSSQLSCMHVSGRLRMGCQHHGSALIRQVFGFVSKLRGDCTWDNVYAK